MKQLYYVIQTLLHGRNANVIKIVSLGLGLMMSILLFSRVAYEQSFDTCFKEHENLCQLWMRYTVDEEKYDWQEQCVGKMVGGMFEAFPDMIESATSTGFWMVNRPLYNGNTCFKEKKISADSLFFQTMGIEVTSGNPVQDLQQADVIYLSERFAKRVFGNENPIGKILSYNKELDLIVKGTYATIPDNCTINPEAVVSMPTVWKRNIGNYSWDGGDSWLSYIRINPNVDIETLNKRFNAMIQQQIPENEKYKLEAEARPIRDT